MDAIGLDVDHIVHRVHSASEKAEDREGAEGPDQKLLLENVFGEEDRSQDEEVLHPLMRASRLDHSADAPGQASGLCRRRRAGNAFFGTRWRRRSRNVFDYAISVCLNLAHDVKARCW